MPTTHPVPQLLRHLQLLDKMSFNDTVALWACAKLWNRSANRSYVKVAAEICDHALFWATSEWQIVILMSHESALWPIYHK